MLGKLIFSELGENSHKLSKKNSVASNYFVKRHCWTEAHPQTVFVCVYLCRQSIKFNSVQSINQVFNQSH